MAGRALAGLLSSVDKRWQRFRFRSRLSIDLDWKGPLAWFVGDTYCVTRALLLTITASKHEEFVLARGIFEVQPLADRRWLPAAELSEFLTLPVIIPSNREWGERIYGPSLAKGLRGFLHPQARTFLRLTVYDLHGARLRSKPVELTILELEREEHR